MSLKFCPLASGSNGNCLYIGSQNTNVLIDAGVSGKTIDSALSVLGVSGKNIDGIFITHEHGDHIIGVGVMSRRYNLPVFATERTWLTIDRRTMLGKIAPHNRRLIVKNEPTVLRDLTIKPFAIPHDAADPVGYTAYANGYKIGIATDLGYVTDLVKEQLADAHILLLESNHDVEMLQNGRYAKTLKDRIAGNKGHLSNASAGHLLVDLLSEKLKHVYLGHLSEENNRPLIALDTVLTILAANNIAHGKQFSLQLASRGVVSESVFVGDLAFSN